MTARDDDDDPQLDSLRAAWRSLPDEDPPERGLGELMAAARAKAEELAKPTWWQRIVTVMKRPPVLAMATILILIGGGIVISRGRDQLTTERPPQSAAPERARATEPTPPTKPEPPVVPAAGSAQGVELPEPVPVEQRAPATKPPGVHRGTKPRPTEHAVRELDATRDQPSKAGIVAPDDTSTGAGEEANVDGRGPIQAPIQAQPETQSEAPGEAHGATKDALELQTSPAQLLVRCRAAAARRDCAAVKTIAKQISDRDAAFYRRNVANDVEIKPCL